MIFFQKKRKKFLVILFVFILLENIPGKQCVPDNDTFQIIGLISERADQFGVVSKSSTVMIEAMKFAVRQVNSNEQDFLHGYKLNFNSYYNIPDSTTNTNEIMRNTFLEDVPFLVGPHSSETSYVTSILSGIFGQSVISYGATFVDFPEVAGPKSNMLRTVPSNVFRIKALMDIVRKLRWNYVSVISSYGFDGERDARYFIQESVNLKICFGSIHDLPRATKSSDYRDVLQDIAKDSRTRIVLLFTNMKDSSSILEAATKLRLVDRFQFFCVLGCTNDKEVVTGSEEVALGTLSLDLHNYANSDFEKYFRNLEPDQRQGEEDSYFRDFWELHFNCSLRRSNPENLKSGEKSEETSKKWTDAAQRKRPLPCSGEERLTNVEFLKDVPAHTVISAVYALACAARDIVHNICGETHKGGSKQCHLDATLSSTYYGKAIRSLKGVTLDDGTIDLHKAFLNANYTSRAFGDFKDSSKFVRYNLHVFRKNSNGRYGNELIGNWSTERATFSSKFGLSSNQWFTIQNNGETKNYGRHETGAEVGGFQFQNEHLALNVSGVVCSKPCAVGFYQIPDANVAKISCCFTCRPCQDLHVSQNGTCVKCSGTEKVLDNKCVMLKQKWIDLIDNVPALIFVLFSILGFISVFFAGLVLVRNNNHKLVRASGRDLFYIMLFGILLTFVYPYAVFTRPTRVSCVFRGIIPGFAFLMCYAPLFLKTNRIYRIFIHGKKSASTPALVSPRSQLMILTGIMAIQILLSSVFFVTRSPDPDLVVTTDRSHIILKCKGDSSPILMGLNLAMSIVFMFSCTVLAFKTRHFPKNFNEAKDIGITLYVTCVIWSVFLPAYLLTVPLRVPFVQEYLITGLSILIGYTSLFGLFGRKLKILLTDKYLNTEISSSRRANGYDCVSCTSHRVGSTEDSQYNGSIGSTTGGSVNFKVVSNGAYDTLSPSLKLCIRKNDSGGDRDSCTEVTSVSEIGNDGNSISV